jgi:hypothetical protein
VLAAAFKLRCHTPQGPHIERKSVAACWIASAAGCSCISTSESKVQQQVRG